MQVSRPSDNIILFTIIKGAMQQIMHATLLKRSDAPLYCIYIGVGWASFAEELGRDHCFEVQPLLIIPNLDPQMQQRFDTHNLGTIKGWFEESNHERALSTFLGLSTIPINESVMSVDPLESVSDVTCDVVMDIENTLWTYVETCESKDATKSADIHTALEKHVGKKQARELLARTKATVAQDSTGKKNRVLRLDGSLLKLRVA